MRVCPLLERETPTRILDDAPAPWVLKQCLESGFVFLENPPDYAALFDEFAWEGTFKKEADRRRQTEPILYSISEATKQFRERILKRNKMRSLSIPLLVQSSKHHSGPVRFLDVGCGGGGLIQEIFASLPNAVERRCVPHGIEISRQLSQNANINFKGAGGECINDTALNGFGKLPSAFLDLVIMASFLEHEINPMPLLRACYERLRPGGSVIVKVPNYASINRSVRGPKWCGFRWPDHVNYFTPATLIQIAEKAGFIVARMRWADKHPLSDTLYAILRKPI